MKKIIIPMAVALAAGLWCAAKSAKDPVIMTVDGQPVTLSEFEYVRNKNVGQQLEEETLDQFLDRFVNYKLKVAAARHAEVDTTKNFRDEYAKYRRELAAPYLQDTTIMAKIYEDSYLRTLEDVNFDHFMVSPDDRALADSVYAELQKGADFNDMAMRYSKDPSLRNNQSHYGWITSGSFPYEFEKEVWATPVGQISGVITTPYGFHIVKVLDRRPAEGEIHASHILITPSAILTAEEAKAKADSIYSLLQSGRDFGTLARELSDCPSASKGGDLDWFSRGAMVPEFEDVAFALKDGEFSEPFLTRFGYHIVMRQGSRQPSKETVMERIKAAAARDGRSAEPRAAKIAELKSIYPASISPEGHDLLIKTVADSTYVRARHILTDNQTPLFLVADSVVTISQFLNPAPSIHPQREQVPQVEEILAKRLDNILLTYYSNRLDALYPEFRNVDNEYREGLMLFEISEQKIWNKPTDDPAGLEAYFEQHKADYNDWKEPRWKGFVIYASTDSLIQEVDKFLAENKPEPDSVGSALRNAFPRNIRIERVVLPPKNNMVVDYLGFGGEKPVFSEKVRMPYFTSYMGRLISAPEEVADIRGRVSADWIEELDKEWIDELRNTYRVEINKKVLKKLK